MLEELAEGGTFEQLAEFLTSHPASDPGQLANALAAAVFREDVKTAELLLDHGATPNSRPSKHMPPLFCAVEQMNPQLIRLLCERGADVNFRYENGVTPLHWAIDVETDTASQAGRVPTGELVELLLTLGADPTVANRGGLTPIDDAERTGFKRAVELCSTSRRENRIP